MKWEYCEHCYIDGHCENQDRGHECNMYAKRITDKAELLQKQLEIAVTALEDYAESDNWELENEKYIYWAKKGHPYPWRLGGKALKEIEELNEIHKQE